jgi:hypothetical protein
MDCALTHIIEFINDNETLNNLPQVCTSWRKILLHEYDQHFVNQMLKNYMDVNDKIEGHYPGGYLLYGKFTPSCSDYLNMADAIHEIYTCHIYCMIERKLRYLTDNPLTIAQNYSYIYNEILRLV